MVRAVGVEPTRALRPCGFSYRLRLSPLTPPRLPRFGGFAVWTIPSPYSAVLEVRCCPSSLYTFLKLCRKAWPQAWLGIASEGFPEFEQFCIAGFPAGTQGMLSPLRMPFRHARVAGYLQLHIIEQVG